MAKHATSEVDAEKAILCGEFVESVYDSINTNEGPFLYFPLYGKSRLFPNLAVGAHAAVLGGENGYRITRYLYCTTQGLPFWPTATSWMGYIAECSEEDAQKHGRRDIVVAIRGTLGTGQWIQDFRFLWSDFPFVQTPASGTKVHSGFLNMYTSTDHSCKFGGVSMRDQIFKELRRLLLSTTDTNRSSLPVCITITGHSLGAALATLAACDVGCNIAADHVTVSAITFASPRVGNDAFKQNAETHTAFITRYRSLGDPMPLVPPSIWPFQYVHVGTEVILDWTKSPYVSISIWRWHPFSFSCHNLELHLHVLAAAEDSRAVYTSMDGLLPDLAAAEARSSIYVMDYLSYQRAWESDHKLLREELEQVKQIVGDDQEAFRQYLREVAYIAQARGNPMSMLDATVSRPIRAGIKRLRCDQESPFDKRDYSLLNKGASILKEEFRIPEAWLVHPNKDMVYDPVAKQWLSRVDRPQDIPEPSNEEYN